MIPRKITALRRRRAVKWFVLLAAIAALVAAVRHA
jgi:hypothetical protein